MKKFVTVLLLMLLAGGLVYGQAAITTVWEKSAAQGTKPNWFDTANYTRGLDYRNVAGNDRVYVVSRNGGSFIYILDAATGDSLGRLDNRGLSGGTYAISDVGVSEDGVIYVCNLTLGSASEHTFKVYAYKTEADSPIVAISYDATGKRMGDKITVTGSTADNSVVIWSASANSNFVVKFTTTDNGMTFTPTVLDVGITGGSAAVGPLPDGSFYWNASGKNAMKFKADGVAIGTIPGTVVATGTNSIRYLSTIHGDEFFVTYQYGSGNENARIVRVPLGDVTQAQSYVLTTTLGTNTNTNGAGDVSVKSLGGDKFRIFVLSCNNGLGAYDVDLNYLVGNYYIGATGTGPNGSDPEFASLKAACDQLNQNMILGDCRFLITSDLSEASNVALGVNPGAYSITFKPYTGVSPTITFTQATDAPSTGISGGWVIGTKDLATTSQLVTTNNITIDGSNTEGGTTRDMMITTAATAHGNATTLRLIGDVNRSTVKNVKVWAQQSVTYALLLTYRYDSNQAKFFIPDTVTVENCEITNTVKSSAQALAISTYGTPAAGTPLQSMKGIVFRNNKITAKTRGLFLNYAGSTDIIGNEINVIQTNTGFMSFGIFGFTITDSSQVTNIANNKITLLSTANNNTGDYGIIGVQCGSRGIYNVYNNFITGFDATSTAANPNFNLIGIRLATDKVISNVLHNTIHMNNVAINPGTGVVVYAGIQISNGINTVKNNIIYNGEDDFKTYAIYRSGTAGTLTADYNNYYLAGNVNAKTGFWDTADAATLADWKTASGGDVHSVAKAVEFVSGTDLHLTGSSLGDFDLAGTPLAEVTTDIDGEARSAMYPYLGADEGAVVLVPPGPKTLTIAEAKVDADGDFRPDLLGQEVEIEGVITSPNYGSASQYYLQDQTGGIVLYSSTVKLALNIGDQVHIKGKVAQYRGISEIEPAAAENVTVVSTGNMVEPTLITIKDLGEPYEAMLVQCNNVWIVNPEAWPPAGSNSSSTNRVLITDGADTNYIFIDKETDLDGWTPPTGMINLIAECDQYTSSASVYNDGYSFRGTIRDHFIPVVTPPPTLPLLEAATNGKLDLQWELNQAALPGNIYVADSTASAWGSHVVVYEDSAETGIAHVKDAVFKDYTISADFYLVGTPDVNFPLYTGLAIKTKHDSLRYYRFVFRNSTSSSNGQLRLQGYDGAKWYISKYWNPGVDFEPLKTGWHNMKITVVDNLFWAAIDGKVLPGCPFEDVARILPEGYPGVFKYNTGFGQVIFDNFSVTEPVIPPPPAPQQLIPLWAKTQAAGSFPAYMSTSNYTRGMAYGKVNGVDRVYVVTRFGEHRVVIYDPITGDSLGVIKKPPQAEGVGLFHINDVDVSEDGMIFVSNMSLTSDAASPFRVYAWKSETDSAKTVINYDAAIGRLGDMISVFGKASDNTLTIYAAARESNRFVKFTTNDNGNTFTPTVITLPSGNFGSVPNIAQTKDGKLYMKSYGRPLFRMDPTTLVMDTVSTTVVGTGASKIRYFAIGSKEYLGIYYPDISGKGDNERFTMVDVTRGPRLAEIAYASSSIGKVTNGNGTGSVAFMPMKNDKFIGFILGTNNGLAAFTNDAQFVVTNLDTIFYGNTPVLHKNPYGSGYIVGTNSYGDIGKYQWFDLKARDVLHGFKFYFAAKNIVGTPDTIDLVVKLVEPSGAPGATIATVKTTTDVLDTTKMGNTFFLENPITLTGLIFIGFEWPTTADDQFALFADANGEGDKANRVWEKFNDGKYNDFTNPTYSWGLDTDLWIEAYYKKAVATSVDELADATLPKEYVLKQNYPNPFNPTTTIELAIPENGNVEISVYNILGQKVAEVFNGKLDAGVHRFIFEAKNLSSGVYFYHVKANKFQAVKKMTLMK